MDDKETEKTPIVASKSFMAVGPTLHYSHKNVQTCWLLANRRRLILVVRYSNRNDAGVLAFGPVHENRYQHF